MMSGAVSQVSPSKLAARLTLADARRTRIANDSTFIVFRSITLLGHSRQRNHSKGFIDMLAINGFALLDRFHLTLPKATVNVASKIVLDFWTLLAVPLWSVPQFRMYWSRPKASRLRMMLR